MGAGAAIIFLVSHKPDPQSYTEKTWGEFVSGAGKCVVAEATSSSIPLSVPFETAELSAVKTL